MGQIFWNKYQRKEQHNLTLNSGQKSTKHNDKLTWTDYKRNKHDEQDNVGRDERRNPSGSSRQ